MNPEYEYEKYVTTKENVMETINKYGVAIIPNVLNSEECEEMFNGMWDTLETISQTWEIPINRNNPESWVNMKKLFLKHSMLIQQWSIGHAQFIWNLRQNPKCVEVFSNIWKCNKEDLLTSFDGASFHMPSEITKTGWRKKLWYHSDQSFVDKDFKCVQSWVTALDVNEGDGTLTFYEGSNKYHSEFGEKFGVIDTSNWYQMDDDEKLGFYKEKGCVAKCIKCPKGSMVLWDSRTIHCGLEPLKGRKTPNFRCVAYLCYMPRVLAKESQIIKKIKAFEEKRMTTHWPCNIKLFPKIPRTYGAELPEITELPTPIINELGRRLVGYSNMSTIKSKIKTKKNIILVIEDDDSKE
jgi:ectoine hydroxylase-related dioxygenase (phytanoyl-CoA dioxygenase family)